MRKGFAGRKVGVVVCGALGRMGSRIAALAQEDPRLVLVGGVVLSSDLSRAAPIPVSADLRDFLVSADVVVDFTEPSASLRHLRLAADVEYGRVHGRGPAEGVPDKITAPQQFFLIKKTLRIIKTELLLVKKNLVKKQQG